LPGYAWPNDVAEATRSAARTRSLMSIDAPPIDPA
jgi:hypothetical protein